MILVKYRETDSIEGVVENEKGFCKWLKQHNKRRKKEGEIEESSREFDFLSIMKLD